MFLIEPTEEDLKHEWDSFVIRDGKKGLKPLPRSNAFLENSAIYTQLAEKLSYFGVLLMHGSALCMDGNAYVFTAASGTGKSTHARLWRELFGDRVWMINDDKPLLRISQDGVSVYGSPWNGKHNLSCNASAPLKAIVDLNRGTKTRIELISKADAFPLLVNHCFVSGKAEIKRNVAAMEINLLQQTIFYRLFCNMDVSAAWVAWQGMNGGISRE